MKAGISRSSSELSGARKLLLVTSGVLSMFDVENPQV
jgi:hypothetical protein